MASIESVRMVLMHSWSSALLMVSPFTDFFCKAPSTGSSAEIKIFWAHNWIVPASLGRHSLDLTRPPGTHFVFVDRCPFFQDRIHDAPCLFHVILPCEQGAVTFHRRP